MPLTPGTVIQGRYRILKLLGHGGFGAVYQAFDERLDLIVALKENIQEADIAARQFTREASLLAKLKHPNLPRVTDYFIIEGQGQYLVMDYIDGEDLQALLSRSRRPLPLDEVLLWGDQVASAVAYLHGHSPSIIHRDIKPANIKITSQGQAVLVDFGIAKSFDPNASTTLGAKALTPGFSPIEQYGLGGRTDERSDIYSLCATLYALLAGQAPPESVERVSGKALPSLQALNPLVTPQLEAVIVKGIEPFTDNRWQTIVDLQSALKSAVEPAGPARASQFTLPAEPEGETIYDAAPIRPPSQPVGRPPSQPVNRPPSQPVARPPSQPVGRPPSQPSYPPPQEPVVVSMPLNEYQPPKKKSRGLWIGLGIGGGVLLCVVAGMVIFFSVILKGLVPPAQVITEAPTSAVMVAQPEPTDSAPITVVTAIPTDSPTAVPVATVAPVLGLPVKHSTPVPFPSSPISVDTASQVQELAQLGRGGLHDIVYTPDGQYLLVASSVGIYVYDAYTMEEVRLLPVGSVYTLAVSPDGRRLAGTDSGYNIYLWNFADGSLLQSYYYEEAYTNLVVFSPDGDELAVTYSDYKIRLWDISNATINQTLEGHTEWIHALAYSPSGELIAAGSYDDTARIWRVSDGSPFRTFSGHSRDVESIAFGPDDSVLATGGDDNIINVWDIQNDNLMVTLEGHTNWVYNLAFSTDGYLISSSTNGEVWVWNWYESTVVSSINIEGGEVWDLALSQDSALLALNQGSNSLYIYGMGGSWSDYYRMDGFSYGQTTIYFEAGDVLWSVGDYDTLKVWYPYGGGEPAELVRYEYSTYYGVFSADGSLMAVAGYEGTVELINVSDGSQYRSISGLGDDLYSLALSDDGQFVAAGLSNGDVKVWSVSNGSLLYSFTTTNEVIHDLDFAPNGTYLAAASYSNQVYLWHLGPDETQTVLYGHNADVECVEFAPNSSMLASGGDDNAIILWDVWSGSMILSFSGQSDWIWTMTFSDDGSLLAASSNDNSIGLYRVSDGTLLQLLTGQTSRAHFLLFSPDMRLLASTSYDGIIRLWGVP